MYSIDVEFYATDGYFLHAVGCKTSKIPLFFHTSKNSTNTYHYFLSAAVSTSTSMLPSMSKKTASLQETHGPKSMATRSTFKDEHTSSGPLVFSKEMKKKEVQEAAQVIFSTFFAGAINSNAHWYSVKPIGRDVATLSELFGVTYVNFQRLLIVAGIAEDQNKTGITNSGAQLRDLKVCKAPSFGAN